MTFPDHDDMIMLAAVRERGEAVTEEVWREAVYRWWNDPVLHARAIMAANLVELMEASGPAALIDFRNDVAVRDAMRMAAAVALVLAERDPATGEKLLRVDRGA